LVIAEMKMGPDRPRIVMNSEAQILIEPPRVDNLARIHFSIRVPDGLELAKSLRQLVAEHLRQQLGAGLPVSMLARKRSAIVSHCIGRLLYKGPIMRDTVLRFQVEIDARVAAART